MVFLIGATLMILGPIPVSGQQAAVQKLTLSQIEELITHGVPDSTMASQIQRRGVGFAVTPVILDALQRKGAGPQTLAAIQGIAPTSGASKPNTLGDSKNANRSTPSGGGSQASALQHCVHLILQVEVKEAVNAETDNAVASVQQDLKTANLGFSQVFKPDPLKPDESGKPEQVEIDGVTPANIAAVRSLLDQKYGTQYDLNGGSDGSFTLTMRPLVEKALNEKTLQQATEVIRRRMDVLGVKAPLIQEYNLGANQILVEMPGITDLDHVKSFIQSTARLAIHAVKGDPSGYPDEQSALAAIGGVLPPDEELVHGSASSTSRSPTRLATVFTTSPAPTSARAWPLSWAAASAKLPTSRAPSATAARSRARSPKKRSCTFPSCCTPVRCQPRSTFSMNATFVPVVVWDLPGRPVRDRDWVVLTKVYEERSLYRDITEWRMLRVDTLKGAL